MVCSVAKECERDQAREHGQKEESARFFPAPLLQTGFIYLKSFRYSYLKTLALVTSH